MFHSQHYSWFQLNRLDFASKILLSNVKCDLILRIQTTPLLSERFIFIFYNAFNNCYHHSAALYRFKVLPPSEQWFSGQSLQQNKSYFTWMANLHLLSGSNVMQQRNVLLLSSHRLLVIIKSTVQRCQCSPIQMTLMSWFFLWVKNLWDNKPLAPTMQMVIFSEPKVYIKTSVVQLTRKWLLWAGGV